MLAVCHVYQQKDKAKDKACPTKGLEIIPGKKGKVLSMKSRTFCPSLYGAKKKRNTLSGHASTLAKDIHGHVYKRIYQTSVIGANK